MRFNVLFFSKSKRTTEARKHLIMALNRHGLVKNVKWINYSKLENYFGQKLVDIYVKWTIDRLQPGLTVLNQTDIRPKWIEVCQQYGKVACIYQDYDDSLKEEVIEIGQMVDHFYLSNKKQLDDYKEAGIREINQRYRGCSRDDHYPEDSSRKKYQSDVAFIGKPKGKAKNTFRMKLLPVIEEKFDLKVWGPGWEKYNFSRRGPRIQAKQYRKIVSSSKIIIGINDDALSTIEEMKQINQYMSNRDRITLGCGGFLLTNYNKELENIFTPGKHLDFYENINDCVKKIEFYLENEEKRKEIARQGCIKVHSEMTFDHFVEKMIRDIY